MNRFKLFISVCGLIIIAGLVNLTPVTVVAQQLVRATITSIAAGDNNIGNVDIVSGTITTITNAVTVTDGAGALNVIVDSATLGTVTVSDGAGALNVIVDSSATLTVTDGAGAMNVICDSGCSGGTQYTEDAAAAADPIGSAINLVRADTPGTLTTADGDNVALRGTNYGAAYVTILSSSGAVATLATDGTIGSAIGTSGPLGLGVYSDFDGAALPTATNVDTEGENVPFAASIKGVQYMMLVSEDGSLQYGTSTTPLVVGDGTGALNVIIDSSATLTVTDGAGALNVICDSGCSGGTQYTEDAVAAADPVGTAVNLIRADTPATITSANGDNVAQRGTNYGAAYVQVVSSSGAFIDSFGGSGGTAMADEGAFTLATTSITPMGCIEATDTAAAGSAMAVKCGNDRELDVDVTNAFALDATITTIFGADAIFGTAGIADTDVLSVQGIASMTPLLVNPGTATNFGVYAVDAALGATPNGVLALAIRDDALSALTPVEGDAIGLRVDANGALWTINSGSVTVTDGAGALNVIIDSSASLTVTNAGTFATQVDGAALTALQLIDNPVFVDEVAFTYATSSVQVIGAVAESTTDTLADGTVGAPVMTLARYLRVTPTAYSTGGGTVTRYISAGATEDEHAVCTAACTLYSIIVTNTNAAARYLKCENDTAAGTAPGTDTPEFSIALHATGGAAYSVPVGAAFSTGLTCWLVTGAADSDVAEVAANEIMVNYVTGQ